MTVTRHSSLVNAPGLISAQTASETPAGSNSGGVISLTTYLSTLTSLVDASDDVWTLADGEEGQHKRIVFGTDGGDDLVVTPASFHDGTSLTFDTAAEECTLVFQGGAWGLVNSSGGVIS